MIVAINNLNLHFSTHLIAYNVTYAYIYHAAFAANLDVAQGSVFRE